MEKFLKNQIYEHHNFYDLNEDFLLPTNQSPHNQLGLLREIYIRDSSWNRRKLINGSQVHSHLQKNLYRKIRKGKQTQMK